MSVPEFCTWATISTASFYREVTAGRITIRKIGRKSVVTMPDALAWLAALPVAKFREAA
ncbi:DNA-binding protein [Aureimonas flava]|uniref:DNA-binding protein n=2 Tax=Aureimonas flava TaxID=2320271 RepID=A0A3A1WRW3_9HYPH|nr:DNA-binding protein [Aureimonas flava]